MSAIQCFQCGKMGHFQSKCPKAKSKKATAKQTEKEVNMVLMTVEGTDKPRHDIWIADSAASTHINNKEADLFDVKKIREPVKIRDGNLVYATKVGKL